MFRYYDPYNIPSDKSTSTNLKCIALGVIVLILASTIIVVFLPLLPSLGGTSGDIKVAVIDSGVNSADLPIGSIVVSKSFVLTQYGYDVSDTDTSDAQPDGVPHGTLVAEAVLTASSHAGIVNAKVISSEGHATTSAIVAAISWAIEQNCDVINLSVGSSPTRGDPILDAIDNATRHGVVVVSSAGNEGDSGLGSSSISSPAIDNKVISVGALDEQGNPADYSSTGPTSDYIMKPDIMAPGYFMTSNRVYYGTSFSSPRVAGYAADLIYFCQSNNIRYTVGLIKSVLMKTADMMDYPEYVVGAGAVNFEKAKALLSSFTSGLVLPVVTYIHPQVLPLDYEQLFYGDNYTFGVQIINSGSIYYNIDVESSTPDVFNLFDGVTINQSGVVPLLINVPKYGPTEYSARIAFASQYSTEYLNISFSVKQPVAHVAFDVSHSAWSIDTHFGQFRELYKLLVKNSISVTELRKGTTIDQFLLNRFDAVLVLDPCTWDVDETDPLNPIVYNIPYTPDEIEAYRNYFNSGGGIFVAALDNKSLNVNAVNDLLSWSGFSLGVNRYPAGESAIEVTNLTAHPITSGVTGFDFVGVNISVPTNGTVIASYQDLSVMGCLDHTGGGKLVVTGTNFFVDNWGLSQQYVAKDDKTLALQIVLWLTNLL